MKLPLKVQYGILFAVYLARAGRSKAKIAALNLNLKPKLLYTVALKLVIAGVLKKHPEGFSLGESPTILDVVNAVDPSCLYPLRSGGLKAPAFETRTLAHFSSNLREAMQPALTKTIRGLGNDLLIAETQHLDNLDTTGVGN